MNRAERREPPTGLIVVLNHLGMDPGGKRGEGQGLSNRRDLGFGAHYVPAGSVEGFLASSKPRVCVLGLKGWALAGRDLMIRGLGRNVLGHLFDRAALASFTLESRQNAECVVSRSRDDVGSRNRSP